jgi:PAS domain S-box-containing protein
VTPPSTALDPYELARTFLARAVSPAGFDALFEHLPDVYFFVKNAEGRFIRANRAFVKLARVASEQDVIGKCDHDFFPHGLAENYALDDRTVLESNQAMIDKAELVQHADGSIDWFCTTKLPVLDAHHQVIGICGITRNVKQIDNGHARFTAWEAVLETMLNEYAGPLDTASLARRVGLSISQFNRQFRRRFQTTPRTYLTKVRLDMACHLLITTDMPMSEIAIRTGFYDQSHFTNQFVKRWGMPPSRYRVLYAAA